QMELRFCEKLFLRHKTMTRNCHNALLTRRIILGGAAGLATQAILPRTNFGANEAKPNSVFGCVRVGCITYSYRGGVDTAEYTLECLLKDGLSETELMDGPIRSFAGIQGGGRRNGNDAPPGEDAAKRREAQLAKCAQIKKMYNDAGVNIHIHKFPFGQSDEAIDFNFEVAKALGCKAITTERNDEQAKKLAPFAEKHKIWVAFHNHERNVPTIDDIDPLMKIGDYIGFN